MACKVKLTSDLALDIQQNLNDMNSIHTIFFLRLKPSSMAMVAKPSSNSRHLQQRATLLSSI